MYLFTGRKCDRRILQGSSGSVYIEIEENRFVIFSSADCFAFDKQSIEDANSLTKEKKKKKAKQETLVPCFVGGEKLINVLITG